MSDTFGTVRPSRSRTSPAADPSLATSLAGTGFAYTVERRAEQARVLAQVLPRVRDIRRLGSAAVALAGGPSESASVAGTVPPTVPGVSVFSDQVIGCCVWTFRRAALFACDAACDMRLSSPTGRRTCTY